MSYLQLAKKIQAQINLPAVPVTDKITSDPTEGEIIAVLIDSVVLGAPVWFALRDDWRPDAGDTTPVFYADELPALASMTESERIGAYKSKLKTLAAFPGGKVRK